MKDFNCGAVETDPCEVLDCESLLPCRAPEFGPLTAVSRLKRLTGASVIGTVVDGDPRLRGEQPGERNLSAGRYLPSCDAAGPSAAAET